MASTRLLLAGAILLVCGSPAEALGVPKDGGEAGTFVPKISSRGQNKDGTEKWAYVDIRPQAHMFYWLYHSYHPDGYATRPLILWLQGGPGASSTGYGNFEIIGPLDLELKERNTTWVKQANVLFVDNPVGAGYSYVEAPSAYTRTVGEIADDMMVVLKAFLEENPEFEETPFYIFGQSYGGKMGAVIARRLHQEILNFNIRMKLMGFAMGNSWISPIDSTMTWGHLLYQMSLVDEEGERLIVEEATKSKTAIEAENWVLATRYWATTEGVVIDQTNGISFYNILDFEDYGRSSMRNVDEMRIGLKGRIPDHLYDKVFKPSAAEGKLADPLDDLMNGPIREKLEIIPDNVIWGSQSGPVFTFQEGDFMKPVVEDVDLALKETDLKVIVYQGQLDLICLTKGAMDWVQQLTWENMGYYYSAQRKPFVRAEDKQTEMYVKAFNRFKFYWVLGAGHAVPHDNGWTAYRMLERILADLDV